MDVTMVQLALIVSAVLLLGAVLVLGPQVSRNHRTSTLIATWFVLSAVTTAGAFTILFVAVHALLFTLGEPVAAIAFLASAVALIAIPVAWALVIRNWSHRPSVHA
ncbi:MAG TPA: hypothetical protein VLA23_10470 [Candidatus Limnocylindrales bacterium]|nr:hypothetical protein [Candidatus Limnocylindrales bacterium]